MALSFYLEQAGAFLYSEDSNSFTVTASHPRRVGANLTISINRDSLHSEECTRDMRWGSQIGTQVIITLPDNSELLGMSVSITCKKN